MSEVASLDVIIRTVADTAGVKLTETQVNDLKGELGALGETSETSGKRLSSSLGGANRELREGGRLMNLLEIGISRGLNPMQAVNLVRELGRVNAGFGKIIASLGGTGMLAGVGGALVIGAAAWRVYSEAAKKELEEVNKAFEEHKTKVGEIKRLFHDSLIEFRGAKLEEENRQATQKADELVAGNAANKGMGTSQKREDAITAAKAPDIDLLESQISVMSAWNKNLPALKAQLAALQNAKTIDEVKAAGPAPEYSDSKKRAKLIKAAEDRSAEHTAALEMQRVAHAQANAKTDAQQIADDLASYQTETGQRLAVDKANDKKIVAKELVAAKTPEQEEAARLAGAKAERDHEKQAILNNLAKVRESESLLFDIKDENGNQAYSKESKQAKALEKEREKLESDLCIKILEIDTANLEAERDAEKAKAKDDLARQRTILDNEAATLPERIAAMTAINELEKKGKTEAEQVELDAQLKKKIAAAENKDTLAGIEADMKAEAKKKGGDFDPKKYIELSTNASALKAKGGEGSEKLLLEEAQEQVTAEIVRHAVEKLKSNIPTGSGRGVTEVRQAIEGQIRGITNAPDPRAAAMNVLNPPSTNGLNPPSTGSTATSDPQSAISRLTVEIHSLQAAHGSKSRIKSDQDTIILLKQILAEQKKQAAADAKHAADISGLRL